jgi:cell division protein FtsL
MLMKALPPRITMHLRPVVRRLTILWIVAVVLAATMTISASYHARLVTGACWLALAGLSVYALHVLKHLRP